MAIVLATERLRLRRITATDVDLFMALNADPGVMTYLDWQPPTRQEVEREIAGFLADYQRYPRHGRWVAEDPAGCFVGWFALSVHAEGIAVPSLGYRLRTASWGNGLATEGGRALVDLAFTELNADKVGADTMFINTRSRRVMEKCGLRYVRTYHAEFDDPLPGTEHGEVRYEITRGEWEQARGRTAGIPTA